MRVRKVSLVRENIEKIACIVQIRVNEYGRVLGSDIMQMDTLGRSREYQDKKGELKRKKEREYYARTILKQRRRKREEMFFRKATKDNMGICWECGAIGWDILQEHHPDRKKMPNFTVSMCANCHAKLHFYRGNGIREKNNE